MLRPLVPGINETGVTIHAPPFCPCNLPVLDSVLEVQILLRNFYPSPHLLSLYSLESDGDASGTLAETIGKDLLCYHQEHLPKQEAPQNKQLPGKGDSCLNTAPSWGLLHLTWITPWISLFPGPKVTLTEFYMAAVVTDFNCLQCKSLLYTTKDNHTRLSNVSLSNEAYQYKKKTRKKKS